MTISGQLNVGVKWTFCSLHVWHHVVSQFCTEFLPSACAAPEGQKNDVPAPISTYGVHTVGQTD